MRTVLATRYVTPLREGGSLPAIMEADDGGLYVAKFRGAGQGARALVAEWIAGELGRAAGLRVPELVGLELRVELARNESHDEVRDLLMASLGLNIALDYLPGSLTYDPLVGPAPSPELASLVVLFDALVTNIDRTARNANMLTWHQKLWLIDHGAALYFHHGWDGTQDKSRMPFPAVKDHVLLRHASALDAAAVTLRAALTPTVLRRVVAEVPESWLASGPGDPDTLRLGYVQHLEQRLAALDTVLEEAAHARARLV